MYEPPKRRKLTKAEREKVYAICGGHCAYCGMPIELKEMQVDHVVPMEFCDVYQAIGVGPDSMDSMDNYLPAEAAITTKARLRLRNSAKRLKDTRLCWNGTAQPTETRYASA